MAQEIDDPVTMVPLNFQNHFTLNKSEAISSVTCWDLKANQLLRRMRDLRKCGENAELDPEYLFKCTSKKKIQHCFPIMVSGMRSRNWQALLRYRLGQNCPPLFEEWLFFFFPHLKWNLCCCLELVSSLSGVLTLVREQVRSHSGIHTGESGPQGRGQKRSVAVPLFISLTPAVVAAKGPLSMARALIRAPATALLGQSRSFQCHPKESATWSTGGRARDVWECSLSDFPQIHHFVQSPEDPTMKNTAPGRGDRGRKRQKGGVGKDMGWERRDRGTDELGERARKGRGNSAAKRLEITVSSEHAWP